MRRSGFIRSLTKSRPFWVKAAMLVLTLSAATLIRWYIDRGRSGAPFALYYPLVILVAVAFGGRWAVVAGALSSFLSVVLFFDPAFTLRASIPDLVILGLYAFGCTLIAFFGHLLRATMREADENAAALSSINRELHHRSRNVATVVRALLHRARKSQPQSIQLDQFEAQLTALFAANEILKFGMAKSCDLKALAQAVLRPFPIQQIKLLGPAYEVQEQVVTRLAMILHELATNAVKYGALSDEGGQVAITWADKNGLLQIVWQETGGPPVQQPSREGLGSYLLRPGGGLKAAKASYDPEGLTCHMVFAAQ